MVTMLPGQSSVLFCLGRGFLLGVEDVGRFSPVLLYDVCGGGGGGGA